MREVPRQQNEPQPYWERQADEVKKMDTAMENFERAFNREELEKQHKSGDQTAEYLARSALGMLNTIAGFRKELQDLEQQFRGMHEDSKDYEKHTELIQRFTGMMNDIKWRRYIVP